MQAIREGLISKGGVNFKPKTEPPLSSPKGQGGKSIKNTVKIARTDKDYGSGSGTIIFESNLFTVMVWKASKGVYTELQCELISGLIIKFDGVQDLDTDEKCLEQLTVSEIIQIIDYQKSEAFKLGRMDKAKEIRKCLDF